MQENFVNLNEIAMKIIMDAGDARDEIKKALTEMSNNNFAEAQSNLEEAQLKIKSAHGAQTEMIQQEIENDSSFSTSLLFNHAQDTLMSISSEFNLAKQFVVILQNIDQRIKVLENLEDM